MIKDAVDAAQIENLVGREFNISGLVTKIEAPALDDKRFCVCLDNGVLCQFHKEDFDRYIFRLWNWDYYPYYYYGPGWLKIRVEGGRVYLMRSHSYRNGKYADFQTDRELFIKGTHAVIHGTFAGPGMFGLVRGLLFDGCQITTLAAANR
jgi:hypothetical protein